MSAVENRVDRLEEALAAFIDNTNRRIEKADRQIDALNRSTEELRRSNDEARRSTEELRRSNDEVRRSTEELRRNTDKLQQIADEERRKADELQGIAEQMQQDHDAFIQRMSKSDERAAESDRQIQALMRKMDERFEAAEKDRKDYNKRLAEVSDSVGTLIEDMVAPNAARLAQEVFKDDQAVYIAQRVRRRSEGDTMELDLLAAGNKFVLIVESKRRIRPENIDEFLQRLSAFPRFFPEYAQHKVLPVLASVNIDSSVAANLTRKKVYGLAFGDETMEFVNLGQF